MSAQTKDPREVELADLVTQRMLLESLLEQVKTDEWPVFASLLVDEMLALRFPHEPDIGLVRRYFLAKRLELSRDETLYIAQINERLVCGGVLDINPLPHYVNQALEKRDIPIRLEAHSNWGSLRVNPI